MWKPTIKEVESIGWKLESKHDFGKAYIWAADIEYYNRPTLFIGKPEKFGGVDGYHRLRICKFEGQNRWYGKMDVVFKGYCGSFDEFKLICKLLDLDKYKKIKL